MLQILDRCSDLYLFVDFKDERKTDINLFAKTTNKKYEIINDIEKIKNYYDSNTIIVFTGSLHFVSFIKNNLKKLK